MRVLMVAAVDPTVPNASVTHLDGVAGAFVGMGHTVTLVLPKARAGIPALDPAQKPYAIQYLPYGADFGVPRFLFFAVMVPVLGWRLLSGRYDAVYIRSNIMSWVLAMAVRVLGRVPVITEHNGWISDEMRVQGRARWAQALAWRAQVLDARFSNAVRCVTMGLARHFVAEGIPAHKVFVAGNGTDLRRFRPMERAEALKQRNLPADRFYLGFIGSLAPWHGLTLAVRSMATVFAAHPQAHLLVAGDGPERQPAEKLAASLGIADRITFFGHVPADEAPLVVNCFDIALAPFISERNNAIGSSALKIRDYAATARPILATDIEGVAPPDDRDWLRLCPPDDAEAFAAAALDMLGDETQRATLGRNARQYAVDHFGWEAIASRIGEAFAAISGPRR